jgi:hypothetical protein
MERWLQPASLLRRAANVELPQGEAPHFSNRRLNPALHQKLSGTAIRSGTTWEKSLIQKRSKKIQVFLVVGSGMI